VCVSLCHFFLFLFFLFLFCSPGVDLSCWPTGLVSCRQFIWSTKGEKKKKKKWHYFIYSVYSVLCFIDIFERLVLVLRFVVCGGAFLSSTLSTSSSLDWTALLVILSVNVVYLCLSLSLSVSLSVSLCLSLSLSLS
jgi:hypothetical protein